MDDAEGTHVQADSQQDNTNEVASQVTSGENNLPSSKCLLDSTVDEYVDLFTVDTSKQMSILEKLESESSTKLLNDLVAQLEELIDGLLAKLEEYCSIVESIRYESKDALFTTIPVLHERCEQLQPLFKKIDHIENFISIVSNSVSDAEAKVSKAEKELGNRNLKKILKSVPVPKFLAGKKEIQPYLKQDVRPYDYIAPSSFKTSDYFTKHDSLNSEGI